MRRITPCSLMQSLRAERADVLKDQTISRRARVQWRRRRGRSGRHSLHSKKKERKKRGKGGKKNAAQQCSNNLNQMATSGYKKIWLVLLGLLAASRSASALPWTVGFGGCTFSGNDSGAPLVRSGSCPMQGGWLVLEFRGITAVPADAFAGMAKMQ